MKPSLIICSYNRPPQLRACLATIDTADLAKHGGEIILIYTKADPATGDVMSEYAKSAPVPVKVAQTDRLGLSIARNVGLKQATGELLTFTDDDCVMAPGYFSTVIAAMSSGAFGYGGGGLHDPARHAPGMSQISKRVELAPRTLIGAGIIPGANMFFRKEVFERIGNFREDMGVGVDLPFFTGEDLEIATRASLAGYAGILVPEALITHEHQRAPGSAEDTKTNIFNSQSRGAHYAYLMMHGIHEVWNFWAIRSQPEADNQLSRTTLERLRHEFEGAGKYLAYCLEHNVDLPPQANEGNNR